MAEGEENIANILISEEAIKQKLPSIFVDSIIVDQRFNIVAVSQNVAQFLEYSSDELCLKNINYLGGEGDCANWIARSLGQGFFEERSFTLYTKSKNPLQVGISGFYLGMISDISEYIILKIRNVNELEVINKQLQVKTTELDQFIYRASHDLRGPLATIKGLLNLMKINRNEVELERLLPMLEAHANKLDERLFTLMSLAKADQVEVHPVYILHFSKLETELRKVAEQNAFLDFLELHFTAPPLPVAGLDEILITSFLTNLFLHLLSLPKDGRRSQVFFKMEPNTRGLMITICASGFEVTEELKKVIAYPNSIYTDMVNFPQLANFFAAQKIAWRLKASLKVCIVSIDIQRILISIPFQHGHSLSFEHN